MRAIGIPELILLLFIVAIPVVVIIVVVRMLNEKSLD